MFQPVPGAVGFYCHRHTTVGEGGLSGKQLPFCARRSVAILRGTQLHKRNAPLWRAFESAEHESSRTNLFRPCRACGVRGDAVQSRARQSGTLPTLSVGNGLDQKPISDCMLYCGCERRAWAPSSLSCCCVAARWLLLRWRNVPSCGACSQILLVRLCRGHNGGSTSTESRRRDAMDYRDRCGL